MKKDKTKVIVAILMIIVSVILLLTAYYFLYPEVKVDIYGDKSFDKAQVFADNKLIANMVWDDKNDRTYAEDVRRWRITVPFSSNKSLHMQAGTSNINFKIVTSDNKIFVKSYKNIEDVSYIDHYLKDFELVKE